MKKRAQKIAKPKPKPKPKLKPKQNGVLSLPAPNPSVYAVHISAELDPVAKVGGLADVLNGLSAELSLRGNNVEIILPKFDCMRYEHIWGLTRVWDDLWVPWCGGRIHCSVFYGEVHGRKVFFIEPHSPDNFFNRGTFYGEHDDITRYAFFSRAAMEFLYQSGKRPDILHCHDWPTAICPALLYEIYAPLGMHHTRACFTVHNFKHQGHAAHQLLDAIGLTEVNPLSYYVHPSRFQDNINPGEINLMKAGIVYSNFTTTVSPRHAWEAQNTDQGFGLQHTLHQHASTFGGVLNGVNYNIWNPEVDRYISVQYGVDSLQLKAQNKHALRQRLGLPAEGDKPIVAYVGRLDPQKGLDLVRHSLFYSLEQGAQFVLLGSSPDSSIGQQFWDLKQHLAHERGCRDAHLELSFNQELAHLIYAGADMVVVPSRFEPCGLTQLIAMRYGTIPVVRSVGGLADSVFDADYSERPPALRNGYTFEHMDNPGIESALSRAIGRYTHAPAEWTKLMSSAMRADYSWNEPGSHYQNIYNHIQNK